ncbi:MAG TPA: phage tail tape measure protein [Candidatus Sphingobacterium stercorigallinarum]|nr:phage tail tape measure protein [Candidatus Sphingobacterium stercorigallinarum]
MASKLKAETLSLDVVVNSNEAQKRFNDLGREITDTSARVKELKAEQALLAKEGGKNTVEYKALSKEIRENQTRVKALKNEQGELIKSLDLEQKTMSQLKRELRDLARLRDNSIPGSEQYNEYAKQVEKVSGRLRELRIGADNTGSSIERLGGKFRGYVTTVTAIAASLTGLTLGVRKAITEFTQFDDLLADVMKTTNLSRESVAELNEELRKIETRTSQEDLLGLSRIAGKLGYTEISDITEFVRANNQIVVALNEDLGGNVEETVNKIGKLVDVFNLRDLYSTEDAFLKVGSALNELGMASTANEGYMVEFTRRMAGVAPLAGISIDQILGLGAALDQLGQTEEVSSTALSKLFLQMAKDAETYSKYAGMQVTEFKDLLEKDFMTAFTRVLEGVQSSSNGINELAATLGDLGQDGGRVIGVIGSLAGNVDVLKSSMDLANQSMIEGVSITEEYEIKNETAAAKLEIAKKQLKELWIQLGEQLWPVMTTGLGLFSQFITAISKTIAFISENRKVITVLVVAITSYTVAVNLATAATFVLTRAKAAATVAQNLWNIALRANPLGLVIGLVSSLAAGLYVLRDRTDSATTAQNHLNEAIDKSKLEYEKERYAIEQSMEAALDKTRADDQRLAAVNRLREVMPDVLKGYSDEQIMAGQATAAIKEQIKQIIRLSTVKAYSNKLDELSARRADLQDQLERGYSGSTISERLTLTPDVFFKGDWAQAYEDAVQKQIDGIEAARELVGNKMLEEQVKLNKAILGAGKNGDDDENPDPVTVTPGGGSTNNAFRKELDAAEKHYQDLLQQKGLFRRDLSELDKKQLEELSMYESQYQSKVDGVHRKHGETLKTINQTASQELKRREKSEASAVDSILRKKQSEAEGERAAFEDRLKNAGLFGVKREGLTERQLSALVALEREHQERLDQIDADALTKEIDRRLSENKDALTDLQLKHQQELAEIETFDQARIVLSENLSTRELSKIKTLSDAKKEIQRQQQKVEQDMLRNQLEDMMGILEHAMGTGEFEGIVLADDIFSEKEMEVLKGQFRKIRELLLKINPEEEEDSKRDRERKRVDVLGMSVEDWDMLFDQLATTEQRVQSVMGALNAATQLWGQYNKMVANRENAQLQKDQAANDKKKENLQRRLDSGIISQENYNAQVEKMDREMDRQKAKVARDQAIRDRNVSLMSAIVNTAKAVTGVLPNFVLAAIVGAMGALQIGTIRATPLPEIPGAESGGQLLEVIRSQDNKKFNAKADPRKRGYVDSPTVLVGESGREWVASNDAVGNPQVRPILDVLDTAQKNGSISTLTLSDIISNTLGSRMPGRQSGGTLSGTGRITDSTNDGLLLEVFLKRNIEAISSLESKLTNLKAEVTLLGKNGFLEKKKELDQQQSNGNL